MSAMPKSMKIQYAGMLDNGSTFVNTYINGGPVDVRLGDGSLLPALEEALLRMGRGEKRTIRIEAKDAYGLRDEENVVRVPRSSFPDSDRLRDGASIVVETPQGPAKVRVISTDDDSITIDCNHELAGQNLTFDIELVQDGEESLVELEQSGGGCGCGCDKLKEQLSHHSCGCEH